MYIGCCNSEGKENKGELIQKGLVKFSSIFPQISCSFKQRRSVSNAIKPITNNNSQTTVVVSTKLIHLAEHDRNFN